MAIYNLSRIGKAKNSSTLPFTNGRETELINTEAKKIRNVIGRKNSRNVFAHRPRYDRLMQR